MTGVCVDTWYSSSNIVGALEILSDKRLHACGGPGHALYSDHDGAASFLGALFQGGSFQNCCLHSKLTVAYKDG